jgi:hypothetical protein
MAGVGRGDPGLDEELCLALMRAVVDCDAVELVVDDEGLILAHYREKTRGTYADAWITDLALTGRLTPIARAQISRGIRVVLEEAGFPTANEDYRRYVRTSAATANGNLATEDSDYTAKVRRLLKRHLGVVVLSAAEAQSRVCPANEAP